eukprot:scaffold23965_cov21-Tisochrysis_lutea.AAC.6
MQLFPNRHSSVSFLSTSFGIYLGLSIPGKQLAGSLLEPLLYKALQECSPTLEKGETGRVDSSFVALWNAAVASTVCGKVDMVSAGHAPLKGHAC